MKAKAWKKGGGRKRQKENKQEIERYHVMSPRPMSCRFLLLPSLASETSGAEFSYRQTGCFTSTIPQLPVTLTVGGF